MPTKLKINLLLKILFINQLLLIVKKERLNEKEWNEKTYILLDELIY